MDVASLLAKAAIDTISAFQNDTFGWPDNEGGGIFDNGTIFDNTTNPEIISPLPPVDIDPIASTSEGSYVLVRIEAEFEHRLCTDCQEHTHRPHYRFGRFGAQCPRTQSDQAGSYATTGHTEAATET
jgi:hypothetical protein